MNANRFVASPQRNGQDPGAGAEALTLESDAVLVARAQRDRDEFAALYLRYVDPVYRYAYRSLGTQEAAADATSQIFANAIAALPRCDGATFRSWLFAIAHNVLVDAHRARRPEVALEAATFARDPKLSVEEQTIRSERSDELRALLDQLSPDQRQVVELRLAGLRASEISEVLGRSRAAIDAIHSRAVARLRELYQQSPFFGETSHAPA